MADARPDSLGSRRAPDIPARCGACLVKKVRGGVEGLFSLAMSGKELRHAPLRTRAGGPFCRSRKPTWPPESGASRMRCGFASASNPRIGLRGQEGIVARLEKQRGNRDIGEKLPGAGLCPVILRIAEAMHGAGETIVEFLKRPQASPAGGVDLAGKKQGLRLDLFHERDDESVEVNPIAPSLIELVGTGREIDRRTDCDACADGGVWRGFAEIFPERRCHRG